jgi:hypothetical protein
MYAASQSAKHVISPLQWTGMFPECAYCCHDIASLTRQLSSRPPCAGPRCSWLPFQLQGSRFCCLPGDCNNSWQPRCHVLFSPAARMHSRDHQSKLRALETAMACHFMLTSIFVASFIAAALTSCLTCQLWCGGIASCQSGPTCDLTSRPSALQANFKKSIIAATAASSMLATLLMGVFANLPLAIAPGMGINAFFTYNVVGGYHRSACLHVSQCFPASAHECMPRDHHTIVYLATSSHEAGPVHRLQRQHFCPSPCS